MLLSTHAGPVVTVTDTATDTSYEDPTTLLAISDLWDVEAEGETEGYTPEELEFLSGFGRIG